MTRLLTGPPKQVEYISGDRLLDFLTHYRLSLSLSCEDGGEWVVTDDSSQTVFSSGETAFIALRAAYERARNAPETH